MSDRQEQLQLPDKSFFSHKGKKDRQDNPLIGAANALNKANIPGIKSALFEIFAYNDIVKNYPFPGDHDVCAFSLIHKIRFLNFSRRKKKAARNGLLFINILNKRYCFGQSV